MDIDQLRQFLVVARVGNITRAAERLAMSQPALSRSIQRLEQAFGQPLLERRTRAVELTDAGALVRRRAEEVLRLIDDTRAELTDDGRRGRLRLGAIPTVAPFFLPGFLRGFRDAWPEAELLVHEDTTDRLLARLEQGELDLAVVALPIHAKHLETAPLLTEELLLTLPVGHPLAERENVRLKDVEPYPFILLGEAHCLTDAVVSFCRSRSFQPLAVEQTSQLSTVQELVALGHGVSLAPAMARRLDRSDTRVYRSLDDPRPTRTIAMAWNPYRYESRLLAALREALTTYAAETPSTPE